MSKKRGIEVKKELVSRREMGAKPGTGIESERGNNKTPLRWGFLRVGLLVMTSTLVSYGVSSAGETVIPATPAGGNDLGGATLPPPGLYGAIGSMAILGNDYYDTYGHKVNNSKTLVYLEVAALQYVYPFEVFGGSLASLVQLGYGFQRTRFGSEWDQHDTGVKDAYVDVFKWSKNIGGPDYKLTNEDPANSGYEHAPLGFNVSLGLAATVPMGHYNPDKYLNSGSNLWIISPNIGTTYLSPPDPLGGPFEVSARAYYSFPLENDITHYQTGQVFNIDWAVAQYLSPTLEVGVAGVYTQQTTADSNRSTYIPGLGRTSDPYYVGETFNGNRYANASVGPVISYDLPNNYGTLKFKWLAPMFHQEDSIRMQIAILTYAIKLN
jgi:hypothetical protein